MTTSLAAVVEAFEAHNGAGRPSRVYDLLDMARGAQWVLRHLSRADILRVWLPHHVHDDREVIPPCGQRVADALDGLTWRTKACADHMERFRGHEYGPVILTDFVLEGVEVGDGYNGMSPQPGDLIHLDGLHRMLQWARSHRSGTMSAFVGHKIPR